MEIAANDESGTYRAVFTVSIGGLDLCGPCLSEKVKGRERHTKTGNRSDKAAGKTIAQ